MENFSKHYRNRHQLLLLLLAIMSCFCECKCRENPPVQPPINEFFAPTDLSVVWIRPYHSDTSHDGKGTPLLTGDYVVFTNSNNDIYPQNGGFGIYNKKTGEKHPAWQNEVGEQLGTIDKLSTEKLAGKNNELLIVSSYYRTYAFDINSGAKLWTKDLKYTNNVTNVVFGDSYLIYIPNDYKYVVVRLDAYTGKQTNYFAHVYKDDAYTMIGLNPPSAYIDNNGDTLLFCISGDWAPKEYTGRVWAYCYNTTKNSMQWINKNFTDERDVSGTVAPPILYDHNKWIIQTHRGVHCMDANTGELIWKNLYWLEYYSDGKNDSIGGKAELFTMTPVTLWQDKLYMRSVDGNVYCIDAQTGQEIWRNTNLCATPNGDDGGLPIYQGRLYLAGVDVDEKGDIFYGLTCLDALTGRELWRDAGPRNIIWPQIAIDQETGYLYAGTSRHIMCIDLNKTEENMLKKSK